MSDHWVRFTVRRQKHPFVHRVFRRSREYSARSVVLRSYLLYISFEAISENSELLSDEIATAATETVRYVLDLQWAEEATDLQRSILQHRYAAIASFPREHLSSRLPSSIQKTRRSMVNRQTLAFQQRVSINFVSWPAASFTSIVTWNGRPVHWSR